MLSLSFFLIVLFFFLKIFCSLNPERALSGGLHNAQTYAKRVR